MADTASPPEFQTISVTCDGRRATLTLNRPNRLNALSNELMAGMTSRMLLPRTSISSQLVSLRLPNRE